MFWRAANEKGAPDRNWHGPARVLQREGQSAVWCRWQGSVLKCSPEQVRALAPDEEAAWQVVPEEWQAE
eukprot:11223245-Lingulodinium_polyedra.AAC.1